MIHGVLILSEEGKARLVRFYDEISCEKQQEVIRKILFYIKQRSKDASNFVFHDINMLDCHVVYRKYARLYFVLLVDEAENDLACLDLIQCFVESLDKVFERVCEMDLLFNIDKSNYVLDELLCGGIIINNQRERVVDQYKANAVGK
ncbi:Sigma_adaptin [Hexamita inflata]|uniref:AP complex subunit sigma n=1 Tax=Hexamita inflata TaxID=28002 RepID=A0AA86N8Z3_9EUKA|nr:Sigma adaptin [Hexamita inflata]CAI9935140.1 Sigma adaptin [Hexamita inflata]CAI9942562.1 Sigma adaptin [Hexamita inflata]